REALAVLRPHPFHGAAQEVGEEEAVHQHRFGPRDGLLVARDEPRSGLHEELPRRIRGDEVAGAENVAEMVTRPAVSHEVLEVDDLVAEADKLSSLTVRGDVADRERAPPADLLEEETQVVVAVKAAIDQMDADTLPGERLADGLQIWKDRRLLVEEATLPVPHG